MFPVDGPRPGVASKLRYGPVALRRKSYAIMRSSPDAVCTVTSRSSGLIVVARPSTYETPIFSYTGASSKCTSSGDMVPVPTQIKLGNQVKRLRGATTVTSAFPRTRCDK